MGVLVRAVITGFGLSVGAALYKRVSKQLGIEDASKSSTDDDSVTQKAGGDEVTDAETEPV